METKERVTIVIDKQLLAELDDFAKELNSSRSALFASLLETGFRQAKITNRAFGNRFVAKALHLIFGDAIVRQSELEGESAALPNAATEAIRKSIIGQIKQLSVAQAEAEINRDLGLVDDDAKQVGIG